MRILLEEGMIIQTPIDASLISGDEIFLETAQVAFSTKRISDTRVELIYSYAKNIKFKRDRIICTWDE